MTAYAFRPMEADDLIIIIKRWLEMPHVRKWWHDPAEQFELVSGDLGHPDMAQFIVAADGKEFAYLQCYNLGAWNTGFGPHPKAPAGSINSSAKQECLDAAMGRPSSAPSPSSC